MITPAQRLAHIQPFHVMDLLAQARELEAKGRDIIHMEVGEPDFPTSAPVINAGIKAIATGNIHYTPALGLPALREAIAGFYAQRYGLNINPNRIVITPGASGALLLALGVLLDPEKKVMMADPGYPCNLNFVRFLGGIPQTVNVDATTDFQLTSDRVRQNWSDETSVLMLASPSNPTGTLINHHEIKSIAGFVNQKKAGLIVDEIYHGLIYDEQAQTALSISDDIFVINSFSKYFGMTGWRLGWMVAPEYVIKDIDKLAQNLFLAAPTTAQYAALAAFDKDNIAILEQRREEFKQRRDFLLPALRQLGFEIPITPQGAFYLYANCERFTDDSFAFAQKLLNEIGVAVTPGKDFGTNQPEKYLRFSYTTSMQKIEEAVQRLQKFLD